MSAIIVAMLNSSCKLGTVLSTVAIVTIVMVIVMPGSVAVQINGMTARAGVATSLLMDAETSVSHSVSEASTLENVRLVLLSIALCVPSSVYILLLVGMVTTAIGVRFDDTTAVGTVTSTVVGTSSINVTTTVTTMTSTVTTVVHWGISRC